MTYYRFFWCVLHFFPVLLIFRAFLPDLRKFSDFGAFSGIFRSFRVIFRRRLTAHPKCRIMRHFLYQIVLRSIKYTFCIFYMQASIKIYKTDCKNQTAFYVKIQAKYRCFR